MKGFSFMKKSLPLGLLLLLTTILPIVCLALYSILLLPYVIENYFNLSIKEDLKAAAEMTQAFVDSIPGDVAIIDGELYKGDTNVTDSMFFKDDRHIEITVFYEATRVATSIVDSNGAPILGTPMSQDIRSTVLVERKELFTTDAKVQNQDFYGYYIPTYTGAVFAGIPKEGVVTLLRKVNSVINIGVIVVLAVFISSSVSLSLALHKKVARIVTSINKFEQHNFVDTVPNSTFIREINTIAKCVERVRITLVDSLRSIKNSTEALSDISGQQEVQAKDGTCTVSDINNAVSDIAHNETTMVSVVANSREVINQLNASVEAINSAMSHVVDITSTVTDNCSQLSTNIDHCSSCMTTSVTAVDDGVNCVGDMRNVVREVELTAEKIIAIAKQTSLLSLNASIEAARAGVAGRGFSVVAGEIQKLASESNLAAHTISQLLDSVTVAVSKSIESTNDMRTYVDDTKDVLMKAMSKVSDVVNNVDEINNATVVVSASIKQLSDVAKELTSIVDNISEMSMTNAASTEETSAALENLSSNLIKISDSCAEVNSTVLLVKNELDKIRTD